MKIQPTEGEKIFANHTADKGHVSEYIQNVSSAKIKRQISQLRNGQRI